MNLTNQKSNENNGLTTTTNTNGAENNSALDRSPSSLINEDPTETSIVPTRVENETPSGTNSEAAENSRTESDNFFSEFFEMMPSICLDELLLVFQVNKNEQKGKIADFISIIVKNKNMLWVFIGLAAGWSIFNASKSRGGRGHKSLNGEGYGNAIKELLRIINLTAPKAIDESTLDGCRNTLMALKGEELSRIFAKIKTISAAEIVSREEIEEIKEQLHRIVEEMSRIDKTYYKTAASTTNPAAAIKIAFAKTIGENRDPAYTNKKFERDLALTSLVKQKNPADPAKEQKSSTAENVTFNSGDFDKKTMKPLEEFRKKLNLRDLPSALRCSVFYAKRYLDLASTFKLLDADQELNALEP